MNLVGSGPSPPSNQNRPQMPMSNTGAPNPNQFNQQFYQQQQNFRQPYPQQQQQQYHYQQQQQQQQFVNQAQQQPFQHNTNNTNMNASIPVEKILPASSSSGQSQLPGTAHIPADKQINQLATNLSNLTTNQTLTASKILSDSNVTKATAAEKIQKPAKTEVASTPSPTAAAAAATPLIKPG